MTTTALLLAVIATLALAFGLAALFLWMDENL